MGLAFFNARYATGQMTVMKKLSHISLTDELKNFGQEIGLDIVRVTSAEPFSDAAERIKQQIRRGLCPPNWKVEEIDSFCDPRNFLHDAKSIIVVAECYLTSESVDPGKPGEPHGSIARYTWRNYYYDVKIKLRKIADFLKKRVGKGVRFRCYSNGSIAEKPIAQRAGIGYYGKHGIIITEEYGSWVVLGELITNIKLKVDKPVNKSCGKCKLCIDACPTGAIIEPYIIDVSKCLGYITHNQFVMPVAIREVWGNKLYGCTICQDVCPINRKVKAKERKPEYGYVGPSLSLIQILQMNEGEYRKRFSKNQIGAQWVNFGAIQRNAAVALGNIGDPSAVPVLVQTLKDNQSSIVKMHAAWALGKIGSHEAKLALRQSMEMKLEQEVRKEVENALQLCISQ